MLHASRTRSAKFKTCGESPTVARICSPPRLETSCAYAHDKRLLKSIDISRRRDASRGCWRLLEAFHHLMGSPLGAGTQSWWPIVAASLPSRSWHDATTTGRSRSPRHPSKATGEWRRALRQHRIRPGVPWWMDLNSGCVGSVSTSAPPFFLLRRIFPPRRHAQDDEWATRSK